LKPAHHQLHPNGQPPASAVAQVTVFKLMDMLLTDMCTSFAC